MLRLSLLLFLFVSPLAAANGDLQDVVCIGDGNRTAINSYYDANVRRLAALLQSNTSSSLDLSMNHAVGQFPDSLYAISRCRNSTDSSSCRGCIAMALQEARKACPDHKDVEFFNGNCSLQLYGDFLELNTTYLSDVFIVEGTNTRRNILQRIMSWAMVFQAIGFAWLFFLFVQDSRDRKRRGSPMRSSSPPSGDN